MTVPINDRLSFYRARVDEWAADPASVGLTDEMAQRVRDALERAEEAHLQAVQAREAARSSTLKQDSMLDGLCDAGGDALRFIRAYAQSRPTPQQRDAVYARAGVTPPARREALPPPQQPRGLSAGPRADGSIRLTWRASRNAGCIYFVQRRMGDDGAWEQLAICDRKDFVDQEVPQIGPGATVSYRVTARRGGLESAVSHPATVRFGGGGSAVENVEDDGPARASDVDVGQEGEPHKEAA